MKQRIIFKIVSMFCLFSFTLLMSCTIAKISGRGSIPLLLNNPPAKIEVVSHFKESKMITFDYTSSFDVYEVLAEKLASSKADAVTNLTITIKSDVECFFINLLTIGLANARIFQVEGDLVNAPAGLSSILENSIILARAKNIKGLKESYKNWKNYNSAGPSIVHFNDEYIVVLGL